MEVPAWWHQYRDGGVEVNSDTGVMNYKAWSAEAGFASSREENAKTKKRGPLSAEQKKARAYFERRGGAQIAVANLIVEKFPTISKYEASRRVSELAKWLSETWFVEHEEDPSNDIVIQQVRLKDDTTWDGWSQVLLLSKPEAKETSKPQKTAAVSGGTPAATAAPPKPGLDFASYYKRHGYENKAKLTEKLKEVMQGQSASVIKNRIDILEQFVNKWFKTHDEDPTLQDVIEGALIGVRPFLEQWPDWARVFTK